MTSRRRAGRAAGTLVVIALGLAGVAGVMAMLRKHDGADTSTSAPRATADTSTSAPRATADTTRFLTAREGLCAAAGRARAGDGPGARSLFLGRSEQPLHELAGAVKEKDRPAAARLLEAKVKVEGSLEPPYADLAAKLDVLAQVTGQTLSSVGGDDPGPCPSGP